LVVRRYTLLLEDGEVRSMRKPKIIQHAGKPWAIIDGEKYLVTGRWHHFYYRRWQSFFLTKGMGLQKIWVKGNPAPVFLGGDVKNEMFKSLNDTARAMYDITEFDNPERLMRPRKVDWLILVLVGVVGLAIGAVIGGRV
jgi:hypothetical protein